MFSSTSTKTPWLRNIRGWRRANPQSEEPHIIWLGEQEAILVRRKALQTRTLAARRENYRKLARTTRNGDVSC